VARSVILHYICPSRRRPYSTVIHGFSNVAGNLIQNPSFEAGNYPGGRQRLTAGSPDITNWTVNSGVDYVGNGWNASDGGRSVDLNTLSPGSISQTVTTLPGVDYTVTFDLAGHPSGQKIKQMEVQAGPVTQSYTFDATGSNSSNMRWVSKTFTFTANAASTTVTFRSIAPTGQHGPAIDNVRLVRTSVNNPFSGRALNDYAASVDSMGTSTFPTDDISSRVHNGVIVGGLANSAVRISDIRDGTSSTMMLGEKSIELNFVTMDGGDSHGWAVGCDVNIVRTGEFPPARGYAVPCGPGNTDTWGCAKARFGAEHWVSFNVLYSDSSVRSVKYDVDHNVFKLMIERNDGVAFTDPTIER
jgi:choice-of-anchor C domain-containing protein